MYHYYQYYRHFLGLEFTQWFTLFTALFTGVSAYLALRSYRKKMPRIAEAKANEAYVRLVITLIDLDSTGFMVKEVFLRKKRGIYRFGKKVKCEWQPPPKKLGFSERKHIIRDQDQLVVITPEEVLKSDCKVYVRTTAGLISAICLPPDKIARL
jgi:hypothetical protein